MTNLRAYYPCVLACVVASVLGCAPMVPTTSGKVLPLQRLRLYETGVGYFERSGELHGATRTTLPVPAGHIDDALKTLTIVAEGGKAHIGGVAFRSNLSAGMARALAGLPPKGQGPVAFRDVLSGLRGQLIELSLASTTLTGAVIGLKSEPRFHVTKGGKRVKDEPRQVLLFLDQNATVRRIELKEVLSIRPKSAALRERVKTALTALTKSGRQKARALELLSSSKGPITLGYIAETPLFRVSYRLVKGDDPKAQTLRGWALVHNDSDEAWRGVEISLVSGRPDSFLFPLTVPRYLRRPLVHPKRALPSVPQLINTTPDALWGDQLEGDDIGESYGVGGLGITGTGRGGGGTGSGTIGLGTLGTITGGPRLNVGNLAAFSKAKTKKTGTLFRYRMTRPLDLAAHSSALLPFTQLALSAEKITLVDGFGEKARATVLLENSTEQTLPAGTIAFYDGGIFVGESFLPRTKPAVRRFLQHGTDLDVKVTDAGSDSDDSMKKLVGSGKVLVEHYLRRREINLIVENLDAAARRVFIHVDAVMNARIEGADAFDFDRVRKRAYAIFNLEPRAKLEKQLVVVEGLSRTIDPKTISSYELKRLGKAKILRADQRAALTRIIKSRQAIRDADARIGEVTRLRQRIETELQRLRSHLVALQSKTGSAAGPIVRRVLAAEDAFAANQRRADELAKAKKKANDELDMIIKASVRLFFSGEG